MNAVTEMEGSVRVHAGLVTTNTLIRQAGLILLLAALLALTATRANAATHRISLVTAEKLALENNREIKLAEQSKIAAGASVMQARATMLPTISAQAGYTRNLKLPVIDAGPLGTFPVGTDNDYQFAVVGAQPIFLGFAGVTSYELAKTQKSHSELELRKKRHEILLGVREAYLGAVLARSIVRVQTQAVAQAESTLVQVERKHRAGQVSGFELLRSQVQLANVKPNLVTARSNVRLADAGLRLTIGIKSSDVVVPVDTLAEFASTWERKPLDELVGFAHEHRPDIQQLNQRKHMATQGVTLARSTYYPMVMLTARNAWTGGATNDLDRSAAVGVSLSWTLWDSWKTQSTVQSARVSVKQSDIGEQLISDVAALEVESAWRRIREASENLKSGRTTVGQATEALRLARVLYNNGSSTQLDVLNAQVGLTASQTTYATRLYDYHVAHARLEKALGVMQ